MSLNKFVGDAPSVRRYCLVSGLVASHIIMHGEVQGESPETRHCLNVRLLFSAFLPLVRSSWLSRSWLETILQLSGRFLWCSSYLASTIKVLYNIASWLGRFLISSVLVYRIMTRNSLFFKDLQHPSWTEIREWRPKLILKDTTLENQQCIASTVH